MNYRAMNRATNRATNWATNRTKGLRIELRTFESSYESSYEPSYESSYKPRLQTELQVCELSFGPLNRPMNRASDRWIKLCLEQAVNWSYCTPGPLYITLLSSFKMQASKPKIYVPVESHCFIFASIGAVALLNVHFGANSGGWNVYLDEVQCTGSETNLTDCLRSSTVSCSSVHSYAGVRCQGLEKLWNDITSLRKV